MKITCIMIGKTDEEYLRYGIQKYSERLSRFCTFSWVEIPDVSRSKKLSIAEQKKKEGALILQKINNQAHVILLDEKGKEYRSQEFSQMIHKHEQIATKELCFVIGGPYGFSEEIYAQNFQKMSVSKMTFSHQMIRLFLSEQLYRAFSIIHNMPYHHE